MKSFLSSAVMSQCPSVDSVGYCSNNNNVPRLSLYNNRVCFALFRIYRDISLMWVFHVHIKRSKDEFCSVTFSKNLRYSLILSLILSLKCLLFWLKFCAICDDSDSFQEYSFIVMRLQTIPLHLCIDILYAFHLHVVRAFSLAAWTLITRKCAATMATCWISSGTLSVKTS